MKSAAALLVTLLSLGAVGCGTTGETTTTTVITGASGASGPTGDTGAEPTLQELRDDVLSAAHPAYFNGNVFDCVAPRYTPVSEATACLREVVRWYQERRGQGIPEPKTCVPFYRYICIPGYGGKEFDCPTVLRDYSGDQTVVVSRFADPLHLDEDNDGVGCEPYP